VGWWAVELRESGALVGNVGAFFRETWPEIEIGWNTFHAYWGQGIATEAATEVVRYAFEVRGERRVTALIDPLNASSLRVAAHLGMTYEADADFFGKPSDAMRGLKGARRRPSCRSSRRTCRAG
jgi:RimJ/RimL family protein N-acetyltransferase